MGIEFPRTSRNTANFVLNFHTTFNFAVILVVFAHLNNCYCFKWNEVLLLKRKRNWKASLRGVNFISGCKCWDVSITYNYIIISVI